MQDTFGHTQTATTEKNTHFGSLLLGLLMVLGAGCATVDEDNPDIDISSDDISNQNDPDATVVSYDDYSDPLIGMNRAIFAFNDVTYRYALIPASKGYLYVMPEPARLGVGNFFYNLKSPIYIVNNLLQAKPKDAGVNLMRFGINTTVGILGLFDPAKHWFELEKADTTLGDTLAQYGAGYGVYLVVPFLGPSDLRTGTSTLIEGYLHPIRYLLEDDRERLLVQGFDYFQEFAPSAEDYENLREESDDPYIFFRNMYLQGLQRDTEYR